MTEMELNGILDLSLGFVSTVFIAAMDTKLLVRCQLYFTKPILGVGANNPAVLTGKMMMTNCKLDNQITANGSVWKFAGKGRIIGGFALTGVDVTGITGLLQT